MAAEDKNLENIPETGLRALQIITTLLRRLVYGLEFASRVRAFSDEITISPKAEGGKRGIRGLTIRNIGSHIMYVSTSGIEEKEPILPEHTFAVGQQGRLIDDQIKIEFDDAPYDTYINNASANFADAGKRAIARFLVDEC